LYLLQNRSKYFKSMLPVELVLAFRRLTDLPLNFENYGARHDAGRRISMSIERKF